LPRQARNRHEIADPKSFSLRIASCLLEVDAEIPSGAPEHVVRTVTENSRTLKLSSQAVEKG
jgi:hypothetical protein